MRTQRIHCVLSAVLVAMLVLATVPATAFATTVWAPEVVSQGAFRIDPQGHVGGGYPQGFAVDGDVAYVSSYTGFTAIDVGDPTHPRGLSSYVTPFAGGDLVAKDGMLYLGGGTRLLVVDVSDPTEPSLVTSVAVAETDALRSMALIGDVLYAACGADGVRLVDVSDPGDPQPIGALDIPRAASVSAEATRAYVFAYGSSSPTPTLIVADATDPSAPVVRGECELSVGGNNGMVARDSYVFVPLIQGFDVVDASDADAPVVVKHVDGGGSGYGVNCAAKDASGHVFFGDWSLSWTNGVQSWDASVPASPAKLDMYTDLLQPNRIAVAGSHLYALEGGGISVLDISDPADMRVVGEYHPGHSGATVRPAGDIAYYSDWVAGLVVADLTTPTAPAVIGRLPYDPGYGVNGMEVAGDKAYLGARHLEPTGGIFPTYSLDVADVSTPTAPVLVGSVPSTGAVMGLAYSGGYAFAACDETEGLRVADVSDPSDPRWVGMLDVGWAKSITLAGDRAWVVSADAQYGRWTLKVVDISDPEAPTLVDTYEPPSRWWGTSDVLGAYEHGGRAYVAVRGFGLVTLDADTRQQISVNPFMFDAGPVYAEGDDLYVCGSDLQVYDLSSPDEPVMKGFIYAFGILGDVRPSVGQSFATVGPGLFIGRWTPTPCDFRRVAGPNRFATAATISSGLWGDFSPGIVVLATGRKFPDALAGAPLAARLGSPLLLCEKSSIPASVAVEIRRLGATRALILGSEESVDSHVVDQLHSILETTSPDSVGRIGGPNRFATAAMIAEYVTAMRGDWEPPPVAFIATGRNYPDALSVAGLAAVNGSPILLTESASVPASTAAALEALDLTRTIVLGDRTAVSDDVYAEVGAFRRLSGPNRYATSLAIADYGIGDAWMDLGDGLYPHCVYLATGTNFPDALTAGPAALWSRSPLLLVRPQLATDPSQAGTRQWLSKHKFSIGYIKTLGDGNAVPEAVVNDVRSLLELE